MILDTNALSAWAEGRAAVEAPLRSAERLVVRSAVLGEYYFGIRQSRHRNRRRRTPGAACAGPSVATAWICGRHAAAGVRAFTVPGLPAAGP